MENKKNFEDFDIITDGKMVGVIKLSFNSWMFYFGIYNHKYFSFIPQYTVGCYNAVSQEDDFRLVTPEEKEVFIEDCKALGYPYDPYSKNFIGYRFNRKKDFLLATMPHYVPFHTMAGRTVEEQFMNECGDKMFWIFEGKTWTSLHTHFECSERDYIDVTSPDDWKYDIGDEWNGEELISWWDGNRYFHKLRLSDPVISSRVYWWYFASNCIKFNFYDVNNISDLDLVFSQKNFTNMGSMFIKYGMIDVNEIYMLCKEYFNYQRFGKLVRAIREKQDMEKKLKEKCEFDLL